jgi:hypothetical protein
MRLDEFIKDPTKRWDVDKLDFKILTDRELHRIVDLTEIQIRYDKDPKNNRSMAAGEKTELNRILRKASTKIRELPCGLINF